MDGLSHLGRIISNITSSEFDSGFEHWTCLSIQPSNAVHLQKRLLSLTTNLGLSPWTLSSKYGQAVVQHCCCHTILHFSTQWLVMTVTMEQKISLCIQTSTPQLLSVVVWRNCPQVYNVKIRDKYLSSLTTNCTPANISRYWYCCTWAVVLIMMQILWAAYTAIIEYKAIETVYE